MRSLLYPMMSIGMVTVPVFVLGCSSPAAPASGDGGGEDGGAEASGPVSFQSDLLPRFENSCGLSSACHQAQVVDPMLQRVFLGCNPASPSCSVADAGPLVYPELMKPSVELPTMPYVTPNDAANSYLLRKMENNLNGLTCVAVASDPIVRNGPAEPQPAQPCGTSMPLLQPTDTALNAQVRAWILQGAKNN
jgi:hypothetical protein